MDLRPTPIRQGKVASARHTCSLPARFQQARGILGEVQHAHPSTSSLGDSIFPCLPLRPLRLCGSIFSCISATIDLKHFARISQPFLTKSANFYPMFVLAHFGIILRNLLVPKILAWAFAYLFDVRSRYRCVNSIPPTRYKTSKCLPF